MKSKTLFNVVKGGAGVSLEVRFWDSGETDGREMSWEFHWKCDLGNLVKLIRGKCHGSFTGKLILAI